MARGGAVGDLIYLKSLKCRWAFFKWAEDNFWNEIKLLRRLHYYLYTASLVLTTTDTSNGDREGREVAGVPAYLCGSSSIWTSSTPSI